MISTAIRCLHLMHNGNFSGLTTPMRICLVHMFQIDSQRLGKGARMWYQISRTSQTRTVPSSSDICIPADPVTSLAEPLHGNDVQFAIFCLMPSMREGTKPL